MAHHILKIITLTAIPSIALIGLVFGGLARWSLGQIDIAEWIWLSTLIVGGAPLVWKTFRGLLRGSFASDVVAMLAIVTAVIMGEYLAGLLVVLMQGGGEALERFALKHASSTLEQLLARAPRIAYRQEGQHLAEIDVMEVDIGDTLIVRPGDLVPVDGTILSEHAAVDESALTGEPLNASKRQGDAVLSGSVNAGGVFTMRADRRSTDSHYAKIVHLVREAQRDRPPIQRLADRYAVWFTPLALVMSGIGWWMTGEPRTVLAVLVVATPCPLILATPIAIISGINRAARMSIIVKGGAAIELIGRARSVVFDKTGTLTLGTPMVEQVEALDGISPDDLLYQAGSVEQLSSHVLGRVLTVAAQERCGNLPLPTHFRELPGRGVEGDLEGRHIIVGSPRLLAESFGEDALAIGVREQLQSRPAGTLATLIGINDKVAGIVQFRDHLRSDVPHLIARLQQLGVQRIVMLTGDSAENARSIAEEAGITEVEANVLPADKAVWCRHSSIMLGRW